MEILNEISSYLQKGKAKQVKELTQQAIDEGLEPKIILEDGLLTGLNIVGEKFKTGEVFVPQMLVAARAMNAGTEVLKPYMVGSDAEPKGTIVIGTVKGDLHDIGKNLVRMMMEGKGFQVVDLGVDVAPEAFVQAIQENNADIVACSSLLTTTMGEIANVVKAIEEAGLRKDVRIMVGGAPVTQVFCDQIGADCYTEDAADAADAALRLR